MPYRHPACRHTSSPRAKAGFPLLYKYRPAWDIVVILLMLGGTALCVTSVWIGWKRLATSARRPIAMRASLAPQPAYSGD